MHFPRGPAKTLILWLILNSLILSAFTQTIAFVGKNTSGQSSDGSRTKPYTSLSQAIQSLQGNSFEIFLLGDALTISTTIDIPESSNYVIKPDQLSSGKTHFLLNFDQNGFISINGATLTLERIQINELDLSKASQLITLGPGGVLNLNNISFKDLSFPDFYIFAQKLDIDVPGEINFINTEFSNVENVVFFLSATQVTMENTTFSDLRAINTGLIWLDTFLPGQGVIIKNVTIQDSIFGEVLDGQPNGFLCMNNQANMSFDSVIIKNVEIAKSYSLFFLFTPDDGSLPTLTFNNIWIENVIETPVQKIGTGGLVFFIGASVNLFMNNLTVVNVHLEEYTLVELQGKPVQIYPNAYFKDIVVRNSINPYFVMRAFSDITFERVTVEGNTFFDSAILMPIFMLQEGKTVGFKDLRAKNNTGPILQFNNVYNQTLQDWYLNDLKSSQTLPDTKQLIVNLEKSTKQTGQRPWEFDESGSVTTFQNININGYTDMDEIDYNKESNDTYVIRISHQYGKVYFKDCHMSNIEMGGILVPYCPYVSIDNMTYDADPSIPYQDLAMHRMIQLLQIREFHMTNSRVFNHKNMILLNFYNLYRRETKPEITKTALYFENNVIMNNILPYKENEDRFNSLYVITSPKNPTTVTFKNNTFKGNTVLKGIINNEESAKVDMDFIGNKFENNYAFEAAAAFAASSMHAQFSVLNFNANTFINNTCEKDGGLFFFSSTKHQVNTNDNVYINNSAQRSGGVGHTVEAHLFLTETNGSYSGDPSHLKFIKLSLGNSAERGGVWYLSIERKIDGQPQAIFINTSFEKSTATKGNPLFGNPINIYLEGGALYIATGDVAVQNCKFKENKANVAGGDMKILSLASLKISQVQSTGSYSPEGGFLNAEAIKGDFVTLQDSSIINTHPAQPDAAMIVLNTGYLIVSNLKIQDVSSPIFRVNSASISLDRVSISQVACNTARPFCILQATDSSITVENSQFSDITSNKDLIVIEYPANPVDINNIQMLNIKRNADAETEIFGLVMKGVKNSTVRGSSFKQVTTSSVKAQNSTINILNVNFSNAVSSRILATQDSKEQSRFVVLDASNSKMADSSFVQNSADSQLNGGAIAIFGKGGAGVHDIQRCIFQGNQGLNGGAISVEDVIRSFSITDSQFKDNKASDFGGSIFFNSNNRKGESGTPVLTRITFEGSQADIGAGIYVQGLPLLVQDCVFDKNIAKIGAAVASLCPKTQIVFSTRNNFTNNFAEWASVFMSLGDLNFENNDSLFSNNKANFGGDICTKPFEVRLMIYWVSETFLYFDGISFDYVKRDPRTRLIYDSKNSSLQEPTIMRSGRNPNYLFEFTALDEVGQTLSNLDQIDIKIGQNTNGRPKSEVISFFGKTSFSFKQANAPVFNSFSIIGNVTNLITLRATVSVYNQIEDKWQTYNLPPINWPVKLDPCSLGEIYDPITMICNPCPENSYSFDNPFVAKTCKECFETAVCLGGNVIYPKYRYWRLNEFSDNFVRCPNPDSCMGGIGDKGKNISTSGFCIPGHEGVGCGACSEGYVNSGGTKECLRCSDEVWMHIRYAAFLILQVVLTIISIRSHMLSANLSDKEREAGMLQSSLVKIIIDFLHVLNLTLAFNLGWPTQLNDYMDYTSEVAPTSKDVFSLDCIIAKIRGDNKNLFFIKVLITIVQPVVFIVIALIVWAIIFMIYRQDIRGSNSFREKAVLSTIIIIYILQPDIIKSTFEVFNCRNFGSSSDKRYFLLQDTNIECWTPQHISWILGLAIPSCIVWLVLPSFMILSLIRKKELIRSEEFRRKYNFIFEKYHPIAFYWEVLVLLRKVILIILSVFLTFTYLQAYLSFITLIIAFFLQRTVKPYIKFEINLAEQIGIYSAAGIMYSGLYFVRDEHSRSLVPFLLVLDILSGVLFFGYCIYVLKNVVIQKILLIKEKLDVVIDNDEFKHKRIRKLYQRVKKRFEPKAKQETAIQKTPSLELTKNDIICLVPTTSN